MTYEANSFKKIEWYMNNFRNTQKWFDILRAERNASSSNPTDGWHETTTGCWRAPGASDIQAKFKKSKKKSWKSVFMPRKHDTLHNLASPTVGVEREVNKATYFVYRNLI